MTQRIKQIDWPHVMLNTIGPLIIFVGSAGALYAQVSDLKVMAKETTAMMHSMSVRVMALETKVQFLIDDRKQDK